MNFDAKTIIVKDFLSNGRQYVVPRYQREYSWEKEQLEDFYNDIVRNIQLNKGGELVNTEYFFGTTILIGDMALHREPLEIVDGQQRITTFTIFLSVLSDIAYEFNEKISDNIWNYIIGETDDGEEYVVLENNTAYPYFQDKIQKRLISIPKYCGNIESAKIYESNSSYSLTPEEKRIKEAYEFFKLKLTEENLSKELSFREKNDILYIDYIKAIRDQLLNSQLIYICSQEEEYVNIIFENINSKGKQLTSLDLIKNEIFSTETNIVPKDDAKDIWKKITENLCSDGVYIATDTFFRHFWIAKYNQSTDKDLYDNFLDKIKEEKYFQFLKDLEKSSKNYHDIMKPKDNLFEKSNRGNNISKKEAEKLILSVNNINGLFGITQAQIILFILYEKYLEGNFSFKNLGKSVKFLEEFHYVYNAVCKMPTNKLESKYGKYAREISKAENESTVSNLFDKLKSELNEIKPDSETFIQKFILLEYVKSPNNKTEKKSNLVSKYTIRKIEELSCKNGFYDFVQSSVEHIVPERNASESVCSIGNLVLLEESYNQEADDLELGEKIKIYIKSNYESVKKFITDYKEVYNLEFSLKEINDRSKKMAEFLYSKIVK